MAPFVKRVVIADLKSSNVNGTCVGHYFALALNYKKIFDSFCIFKIAGGPLYKENFEKESLISLPYSFVESDGKFKNFFRMFFNARKLFSQTKKDDAIIIQQSQPAMILLVLLLTGFGKSNLYQIQYSEEPMRRWYFRMMMKFSKRKIKGLICPNETVGAAYGIPYICIPDYLYNKEEKLKNISYCQRRWDFISIGRITEDKGIMETVETLADSKNSLLIAGMPDAMFDSDKLLNIAKKNECIKISLKYLSDKDFDNYIIHSRYCILNYKGTYAERSSGVVLDTLFKGVPVVGKRCRALQFIEDYGMGFLYDDINKFDFSMVLNESVWNKCVAAIEEYKLLFEGYKQKLLTFVGVI